MRLVFVTQRLDPDDPNLAAAVPMVRTLAARADEVAALVLAAAPTAGLPANVRVRTFGARTKAGRGARFALALARELRSRPDAVVAHMSPVYAVLAAPLARPLGVRVVLWFTHWRRSRLLALALRAADVVVSVDARSFPIPSAKVRGIGHGIDPAEFPCAERSAGGEALHLLALGRYSPAKGLEHVLRGVALARERGDVRLVVHGPTVTAEERRHRAELEGLAAALGLGDAVRLAGPVRRSEVPGLLAAADALVNNMRAGAPDKVVYEAAASCVPVLASNPVLDELLGGLELRLDFARERPEELAQRLAELAAATPEARARAGRELRERVVRGHSVETWADGVVEAARG